MAAIWKPVPSYPGMLASSEGEILLPPRYAPIPNGGYRLYEPLPTKGTITTSKKGASHKYRSVLTRHFGNVKVHRAVCEAFHGPAPSPRHVVLHRNEDGTDNRPSNLKWGTQKENLNAPGFRAWCAQVACEKFSGISGMRKS